MRIEKRTMNWIPRQTTWQYQQSLNAKRKAQAQSFLDIQASLAAAIFTAQDNASVSGAELTLKAVLNKTQAKAEEQIASIQKLA